MVCWLRAGNPKLTANKYHLHKELVAWLWALPLWLESPAQRLAGLSDSLKLACLPLPSACDRFPTNI